MRKGGREEMRKGGREEMRKGGRSQRERSEREPNKNIRRWEWREKRGNIKSVATGVGKDPEDCTSSPSSASVNQIKVSESERSEIETKRNIQMELREKSEGVNLVARDLEKDPDEGCTSSPTSSISQIKVSESERSEIETKRNIQMELREKSEGVNLVARDLEKDPEEGCTSSPTSSISQIKSSSSSNVLESSSSSHSQRSISQECVESQHMQTFGKRTIESTSPSLSPRSISHACVESQQMQTSGKSIIDAKPERGSGNEHEEGCLDIFRTQTSTVVKLNKPFHVLNKEKRKEAELVNSSSCPKYLRPGMVLLKNFINHINQVKLLRMCRDLGIGPGGFYQPGYKDGAKLHLHMMCLGMDWDPESRVYADSRSFDGAVPPNIPKEFRDLVDGALHNALNFLRQSPTKADEIPMMTPDICIVNFYSNTGKLGLHQDRDESGGSLEKGLPVVSFSIGDSAEFLYSDGRDEKAEKVILESGDVLIFGGKSRHIFHGVSSIKPNTTPKFITDETNLIPGRLNLTFRQY